MLRRPKPNVLIVTVESMIVGRLPSCVTMGLSPHGTAVAEVDGGDEGGRVVTIRAGRHGRDRPPCRTGDPRGAARRFGSHLDRARASQHLLDEGIRLIANALDMRDQRDPAVLAHSAEDLRRELDERNHWVTLLLQEIARWRLKPFPRKLTESERQFLRNQGQDGST